jgi:hypothetical protein
MLPNPLTPPNEYSAEAIETEADNGTTTTVISGSNDYTSHQFATPMSSGGMGSEPAEGCESMEERSDTHDMSDEDQDMSDGGAELTMTLSHAEELNAELDLLDAEVMGHDNLVGLFPETHYPSITENQFQYSSSYTNPDHYSDESLVQPEEGADVFMQGTADTTNLPTSLSAVSLQLQHIQDGQEHEESAEAAEVFHGTAFTNNSTPSILLPFFSLQAASNFSFGNAPQADFVSLEEMTISHASAGPTNPPQLGTTALPAFGTVVSPLNTHLNVAQSFPISFLNFQLENNSDADPNEVDDQSNLGLGEFLYNWGVSTSVSEESKKRPRGPALPALYKQRSQELAPVQVEDLQGDKCDIQRIDWKELGVSRLEARQMRRSTYRNYTNLRFSYQWHVSRSDGILFIWLILTFIATSEWLSVI